MNAEQNKLGAAVRNEAVYSDICLENGSVKIYFVTYRIFIVFL